MAKKKPKPKAKTKTKAAPMRISVSIPVYINADSGYASVTVCKNEEDAEKFAQQNLADGNSSLDGEVQWIEAVVDENGNIVDGYEEPEESDDSDEHSDDESLD